jgi:hypothetical protein
MLVAGVMVTKKTKEGRSFSFRVTEETLKKIDALRRKELDLPTRGEMLRRLVDRAIEAAEKADN